MVEFYSRWFCYKQCAVYFPCSANQSAGSILISGLQQLPTCRALGESICRLTRIVYTGFSLGLSRGLLGLHRLVRSLCLCTIQRQQLYKQKGAIGSVYTPGFVVNGKEWKGWFAQPSSTRALLALPGIANPDTLHVALKGNTLAIEIQDIHGESNNVGDKYTNANLNIAVLGMGLSTPVTRGENARQTLVEDFVVLEFLQFHWPLDQSLTLNLPSTLANAPRYAVVVFLSESNNQRPLLAAGGLLPTDWQW